MLVTLAPICEPTIVKIPPAAAMADELLLVQPAPSIVAVNRLPVEPVPGFVEPPPQAIIAAHVTTAISAEHLDVANMAGVGKVRGW